MTTIFKNNELKLIELLKRLETKKLRNENKVNDLINDHLFFLENSLDFFRRSDPKHHFEILSPFYQMIGKIDFFLIFRF
jgi:hypothetical protein